jgi:hypothetical protein
VYYNYYCIVVVVVVVVVKELGMKVWNGLIWLRVWTSGRLFCTRL